jgi:hypothetical protein
MDFKYWFKYRFQPKYQYHKHKLGLKPGYYDLDTIYEKAIAHPRFFEVFDKVYQNWYSQKDETSDDGTPVYTRDFGKDMRELKRAAEWMRKGKPRFERLIEKLYNSTPEKPKDISFLQWLESSSELENKIYKRIVDIEHKVYEKTTWALTVIVKNRGCLWT